MSAMCVTWGSSSHCIVRAPLSWKVFAVSCGAALFLAIMPAAQLRGLLVLCTPSFGACAACHILVETLLHTGMII